MSNKGAIKKTIDSKTVSKTRLHSKTSRSTIETPVEVSTSSQKDALKLLNKDVVKAIGDKQQKASKISVKKSMSIRTSSRDQGIVLNTKNSKQDGSTSSSKTGTISSPRYSMRSTRILGEMKLDGKTNVGGTVRKEKGKANTSYSEKRGLSTIYLPKESRISNVGAVKKSNKTEPRQSPSVRVEQKTPKPEISDKRVRPTIRRSSRERKRSRTLSPSEVKYLHAGMTEESISDPNKNRKKNVLEKSGKRFVAAAKDEEIEYEDDFEDYESDFQDCTDSEASEVSEAEESSASPEPEPIEMCHEKPVEKINSAESRKSDEEHMLDSGHYELAEARKRAARMENMLISRVKTPPLPEKQQKVYRTERTLENKSLPLSSTDEGFEDGRSGDFTKSPPTSQISFIDIRKPVEEKISKNSAPKSTRGKELLSMIKLDKVEWSLLESTPIAYEDFINIYGKLNTKQISVQTQEDDLEVETQTETIKMTNRWTQFPITCRKTLNNNTDIKLFKMEQVGAGEDVELDSINFPTVPPFDVLRLNEFLRKAGRVVLSLLEEKKIGGSVLQRDVHELPFSEGFIKLAVDSVSFLENRSVSLIHYSETLNKMLLTIHAPVIESIDESSKEEYLMRCCIGCVWSTSEPSRPMKLVYSGCPITACSFHSLNYNVIFAGLEDGTINLWDLREDETRHHKVTDKVNEVDWTLRSPTYTTADIDAGSHNSQIVAIRIVSSIDRDTLNVIDSRLAPIQICTLDDEGRLIIWSVLYNLGIRIEDLGLAHWGDIRLQKSQEISLDDRRDKSKKTYESYYDMHVDSVDTNSLFLATNSNNIMHATCIGNKVSPQIYRGNGIECSGGTRCIERCPFEKSYFLVGCDDGTIRLHSLHVERSLLQLKDEGCRDSVKTLQWSKSRPFTIFVLDVRSNIHVWNLSESDIFPTYTISTKSWGYITSMQLSPCKTDHDMTNQYLALGTSNGRIEIHKLNKDFTFNRRQNFEQELDTFLRYVDIL